MEDWNKADSDGNIDVPDYLDELIDKVGMQIRLHRISGKNEVQAVFDIVKHSEKFAKDLLVEYFEWRNGRNGVVSFEEDFVDDFMNMKASNSLCEKLDENNKCDSMCPTRCVEGRKFWK